MARDGSSPVNLEDFAGSQGIPRAGEIIAGKYEVDRVLGVGGMGVVVAARHIQLDEKVALKFLRPDALGNTEAVARFVREARAAVKIKSEHVARVTDVGTLPGGSPYMAMEYLEGKDLAAWVHLRGALPVEQTVEFVLQACVAVADAHALGIVHRDLKPANLFCVRRSDGQLSIKVLDFGISKVSERAGDEPAMALTKTSAMMGSPLYMSPEQLRSARDVDTQTDIWALGVILFELIAGRTPFRADSLAELAIAIHDDPAPSIRLFRRDVPSGLEAVVFRCLEKDRRKRYRDVGELASALVPFAPARARVSVERISGILQASGLSSSAPAATSSPAPGAPAPASAVTTGSLGRTTRPTARTLTIRAGIAGAILLFAALGATAVIERARVRRAASAPAGETARVVAPPASETPSETVLSIAPSPAPVGVASAAPVAPVAQASTPANVVPASPARSSQPAPRAAMQSPRPAPAVAASQTTPSPTPALLPTPVPGKTNCTPPYVIDSAGDRQYKPECL